MTPTFLAFTDEEGKIYRVNLNRIEYLSAEDLGFDKYRIRIRTSGGGFDATIRTQTYRHICEIINRFTPSSL